MLMKIDGVSGDSKNPQFRGWSDVLSWNWGMTSNRKGANAVDGEKTSLNEISIIKPIGIDSATIRLLFAEGKKISSVDMSVTPVVGQRETQTKYMSINLQDVMIKSVISGGGVEDNFFKEHITLLFDRIRFEFSKNTPAGHDGAGGKTEDFDFRWNVPSNIEWKQ